MYVMHMNENMQMNENEWMYVMHMNENEWMYVKPGFLISFPSVLSLRQEFVFCLPELMA